MTPHEFLSKKMQLACRFPYRERSGYRDPISNRQVGGVVNSKHQLWLATDIVLHSPHDQPAFIEEAQKLGLKVLDEGNHLHIQTP